MKGESWTIDPETRDYSQEGGSPVVDRTLKTPAYLRLTVPRTRWLYAPNASYGSDYWTQNVKNDKARPGVLEAIGKRALQPMVDDGRATEVSVVADDRGRYHCHLDTKITDAQGQTEEIAVTPMLGGA